MVEESQKLFLSDVETGDVLGVPASTVRHLHRLHELRGVVIGRHLRWSRESILRYAKARAQEVAE